jgi:hypothetical protein
MIASVSNDLWDTAEIVGSHSIANITSKIYCQCISNIPYRKDCKILTVELYFSAVGHTSAGFHLSRPVGRRTHENAQTLTLHISLLVRGKT